MNIYEAIADIMSEGYSIGKKNKNQQQGFNYRGIDDVMNVFQPLMAARGVFVVPEVMEHYREERQTSKGSNLIYSIMKMKYTFYATDGSSVSAVVIGEGMDSADKSSNKAMSVAFKYALFQTFCIPTEEMRNDDPDKVTPEASKPAQKNPEQKKPETKSQPVKEEQKEANPEEKKEASAHVNLEGNTKCEVCGQIIKGVKAGDSFRTATDIEIYSYAHFGKKLCNKHLREEIAKLKEKEQK